MGDYSKASRVNRARLRSIRKTNFQSGHDSTLFLIFNLGYMQVDGKTT